MFLFSLIFLHFFFFFFDIFLLSDFQMLRLEERALGYTIFTRMLSITSCDILCYTNLRQWLIMGSEWGIPVDLIAIANWSLGCYLLKNIQNKIANRKIELFHNFVSVHCSLVVICGKEVDFVVL